MAAGSPATWTIRACGNLAVLWWEAGRRPAGDSQAVAVSGVRPPVVQAPPCNACAASPSALPMATGGVNPDAASGGRAQRSSCRPTCGRGVTRRQPQRGPHRIGQHRWLRGWGAAAVSRPGLRRRRRYGRVAGWRHPAGEGCVSGLVEAGAMRWVRLGIVGAAMLLALHVDLLSGVDIGHPHLLVTARPSTTAGPSGAHGCPSGTRAVDDGGLPCHARWATTGARERTRHLASPPAAGGHASGRTGLDTTDLGAHHPRCLPKLVEQPDRSPCCCMLARQGR
jgi:hypothetical protein